MCDRSLVLHCYQLNSGTVTRSLRADVGDEIIALLAPLLKSGVHRLLEPMDDYECRITVSGNTLLATICCDHRPCLAAGVAADSDSANELWQEIECLFQSLHPVLTKRDFGPSEIRQPPKTPWCVGMAVQATEDEARWMEDFTRCLAWAWIIRGVSARAT